MKSKKNIVSFAEYVSPGHPDSMCDIISCYLLDKYIEKDPNTRYAVEVLAKGNDIFLGGEVTSKAKFSKREIRRFVREAIESIGYTHEYATVWGRGNTIDPDNLNIKIRISEQSPEIGQGVSANGWGDQGIFYGYADIHGDEYGMPLAHSYAKSLCYELYDEALNRGIGGLDIKTEILMSDDQIQKVIAAVPCRDDDEYDAVVQTILEWLKEKTNDQQPEEIILNGTGNYVMHSSIADCGVTGRKLAVNFYGGASMIGGGAVLCKDASKADVSLNLYARKLAKEFCVKEGASVRAELACCIGKSTVDYQILEPCGDVIKNGTIEITPEQVKKDFHLDTPIFASMARFGIFGEFQKDKEWEKV